MGGGYGSGMSVYPEMPDGLRRRLESLAAEHARLGAELEDPAVLADHRAVRDRTIRRAALQPIADDWSRVVRLGTELVELQSAADAGGTGGDRELAQLAREELPRVRASLEGCIARLKGALVQSDDNQIGSVMLELRAGTGGEEAALWAGDLLEMYRRYASRRGWGFEVLDLQGEGGGGGGGGGGGVRGAVVNMRGPGVWSAMNFEAGVHSVKRVPATESQGRVHTSTATVAVLPEPEEVSVKIDWANDVEEFATTSQGPGGQNVNKVATAVQVKHKPTGIVIRIGESKSQSQNRERARRLLMTRLHELERQRKHAERSAARSAQIGGGERSEKIRTYRYKEGIVADERLPGEYALRDLLAGDWDRLHTDLIEQETMRRIEAL
jgi:peptide chain release factor 1